MRTVRLLLVSEDDAERHDLELTFEPDDMEVLSRYVVNCDRLANAKILQKPFPSITNIRWTAAEGMRFEVSSFDYGEVCELLHLARPIFLSKEPASFARTQAIRQEG